MNSQTAGTAAADATLPGIEAPATRLAVAVETPQHAGLGGLLDYLATPALPPGTLVRCPLGRRTVPGIVWGEATGGDTPAERLRGVAEVMDSATLLHQLG